MHTQVHHNTCDFYIAAGVGGPIKHGTNNSHSHGWQTKLGVFFQVPLSFYMTSTSSIIIVSRARDSKEVGNTARDEVSLWSSTSPAANWQRLRQNFVMDSSLWASLESVFLFSCLVRSSNTFGSPHLPYTQLPGCR